MKIAYRRTKIHKIMQINVCHGEMFQRIFECGLPYQIYISYISSIH